MQPAPASIARGGLSLPVSYSCRQIASFLSSGSEQCTRADGRGRGMPGEGRGPTSGAGAAGAGKGGAIWNTGSGGGGGTTGRMPSGGEVGVGDAGVWACAHAHTPASTMAGIPARGDGR